MKVVLFKSESPEDETDKYKETLKTLDGITDCVTLSPIAFEFLHENHELQKCLKNSDQYCALVLTSLRCVKAVQQVTCQMESWNNKIFTVGETTAAAVKKTFSIEAKGSETGSAKKMCEEALLPAIQGESRHVLMPCGNKRLETVKDLLTKNNIQLKEVLCYKTVENPQLIPSIERLTCARQDKSTTVIFVLFSPSGVAAIKPHISSFSNIKYVAIGPTTARSLEQNNIDVAAVCDKPTAESLKKAISTLITFK